eukprot:51823_1
MQKSINKQVQNSINNENRLSNVLTQKDLEIEQFKKEQGDSAMLSESIENLNEEHKDLQQQLKKEQVASAMLVQNVQYLNEENKYLEQQIQQNEEKSNDYTINDNDNATFIHSFNNKYINKKKW